jgi:hypothetical protein
MTQFFTKFPKMAYDIDNTGTNVRIVTDIIHRAKFIDIVRQNAILFYPYDVKEGETPEIIAAKLYDSSQYHWVVLFANDIHNLWTDWPLSYEQLIAFFIKTYGSMATAQTTVDHYEASNGDYIDLDTYNATLSQGSISVYADEYWISQNDAKKIIRLIDPQYISLIESQLDNILIPQ